MAIIYKEKRNLYLANYNGNINNTFKTAYNSIQPTQEDRIEIYSDLPGLGPITLHFTGVRTFFGKNSDGSWIENQIHSDQHVIIRGNYVDFYIIGGSVDVDVFRSTGANPPYYTNSNNILMAHLPEPLKGSGEI